jgi:hypothetical protein
LTCLKLSKVKFEWHSSHQQAFDKIKKVIGTEMHVLLCYPNFNKPFPIHLYTLWAFIMQDRKPIDFYLLMLNTAQNWYTTSDRKQEVLSAIETFKEYKNILLGYLQ